MVQVAAKGDIMLCLTLSDLTAPSYRELVAIGRLDWRTVLLRPDQAFILELQAGDAAASAQLLRGCEGQNNHRTIAFVLI
jgi:hypothetical protein